MSYYWLCSLELMGVATQQFQKGYTLPTLVAKGRFCRWIFNLAPWIPNCASHNPGVLPTPPRVQCNPLILSPDTCLLRTRGRGISSGDVFFPPRGGSRMCPFSPRASPLHPVHRVLYSHDQQQGLQQLATCTAPGARARGRLVI